MRIIKDYHTHTIYSRGKGKYGTHAKGTIRENAQKAYEKGLKEIAITDHGPGHAFFGLNMDDLQMILEELKEVRAEFEPKGLKVLLGCEFNLLDYRGTVDATEELLKHMDIVMLGFHYGATPSDLTTGVNMFVLNPLSKFFKLGNLKNKERNTNAMIRAMDRYPIDVISHPGAKMDVDIGELAKAATKKDVKLEINSKHGFLTPEDICNIKDSFSGFIVGSDAHKPDNVGNFEKALNTISEIGLDSSKIWNAEE